MLLYLSLIRMQNKFVVSRFVEHFVNVTIYSVFIQQNLNKIMINSGHLILGA